MSEWKLPEYGRMLGRRDSNVYDSGKYLYQKLWILWRKTGKPLDVNWDEPEKVARSIKLMKIKHAVLTSVDRDDLKDMGSILWAETVNAVRRISPGTTMETLIPDFQGITKHIDRLIEVAPEVISHNMETVKRLTREVRIQAKYERSLEVLRYMKEAGQRRTKTGVMLGLGEEKDEVFQTIEDIRNANVDVITLGQYLQPTKKHLPVKDLLHRKSSMNMELLLKALASDMWKVPHWCVLLIMQKNTSTKI